MAELIIKLNDRLHRDIETYCEANNLLIEEYLSKIIEERHLINKYGDLNEIIPKAIEEKTVEVKKKALNKGELIQKEDETVTSNNIVESTQPKSVVKRKRTLKTL